MSEAVHWVAKTYIRPEHAAQLGLMGPSHVTVTQLPWPTLNLPPMTMNDFGWTNGGVYQAGVELPYPDTWYSGSGMDGEIGAEYGTNLFIYLSSRAITYDEMVYILSLVHTR